MALSAGGCVTVIALIAAPAALAHCGSQEELNFRENGVPNEKTRICIKSDLQEPYGAGSIPAAASFRARRRSMSHTATSPSS